MENKSHAFVAGLFVLGVTALLVVMAVWLSRDTAEKRVFEISSRESVTGLQPQAGVRYKGVAVGRVNAIELDPKATGHVLVRIAVNDNVPISQATFASLGFQGVTGLAFIQLDDAGEAAPPPLAAPLPGQLPRISMRAGLMSRLTEQGSNLVAQLEQASVRANLLLAAENQKHLMDAIQNMGQAAASITKLSQRADQVLSGQGAPGQPSWPQLAQEATASLKSMQATSERLSASADAVRLSSTEFKYMSMRMSEPGGTLDKIAEGANALSATGRSLNTTLVPRLNRTAEDTARAMRQVGRVADSVGDNPQTLLLGRGQAHPGPGEGGFVAPPAR